MSSKVEWIEYGENLPPEWPREPKLKPIERIARQYLHIPNHERCEVSPFARGLWNKTYKIKADGLTQEYLLKVALGVNPYYKTVSEVATIHFIQQRTHIPVANIIAYDSIANNVLGFEWILMEKLPGEPLSKMWEHLSYDAKQAITQQVVSYQSQLFDRVNRFDAVGSLFPTFDPYQPFELGRMTNRYFCKGNNIDEEEARGPYKTASDMMSAFIDTLQDHWLYENEEWNDPPHDKEIDRAFDLLPRLTKMLPQLIPQSEETITETVLWHWDLGKQNILVDNTGNITGIIDWECCDVVPLWQAHDYPKFLQGGVFHDGFRSEEPDKNAYCDSNPSFKGNNYPKGFDAIERMSQGWLYRYWDHREEWELTQMRLQYDLQMLERFPWWWDWREDHKRMRDLQTALADAYFAWYHTGINQWLDQIKEGKDSDYETITEDEPPGWAPWDKSEDSE